jgi:uncharacterized cupredoxin-like copper-binding protein
LSHLETREGAVTTTDTPETGSGQPLAEAPGSSEIFLGAGQALWLALVTVVAVAALVLALVAVAVTYSEDDPVVVAGPAAAPSASADYVGTEFQFDPSTASVIAGPEVEINLVNDGAVQHELVILNAGITIGSEAEFLESLVLGRTEVLDPGDSGSVTVSLQPGTYQIVCMIAGHLDAGMEAQLVAS